MFDKVIWLLRWVAGVSVGCVMAIWLLAVIFALVGFRKTAETLNDLFLDVLPYAAILIVVTIIVALIRKVVSPMRTQP